MAAIGEGWCFFANGISYVAVIAGLLLMVLSPRERVRQASSGIESIKEGFLFVAGTGPIRALLLLLGLVSLTGMPYTVLMPVFAGSILHSGARGDAHLGRASRYSRARQVDHLRCLRTWLKHDHLLVFAFFRASVALLVPVGFCMLLEMASSNTLIQSMAPDQLRGQVQSFYSMMLMGMAPFGSLIAGVSRAGSALP